VTQQACLRLHPHRRRRGWEKKDKDTGYLKGNLDSQFQQEIRQCLGMTLSGTQEMTRSCDDFIHCILEGLRRAKVKLLNYSQVMAV
jgi:hypothetical protein